MKKILFLTLFSYSSLVFSFEQRVYEDDVLYCVKSFELGVSTTAVGLSCVSKVSMQKDKLEIEVLKLQKEKLLLELKKEKSK